MDFIRESEAYYYTGLKVSTVFHGDAEVLLKKLPDDFFRCCITSPPYWGLRDYNAAGQIGAEADPQEYIQRLVSIFEEVRRVLTANGTLWLNIGDSYTSGNRGYRKTQLYARECERQADESPRIHLSLLEVAAVLLLF